MPYVSEWEPISAALHRIVDPGLATGEAKRQLCAAIGDGKIGVRLTFAADLRRGLPQQHVSTVEFPLPAGLSPRDIDWRSSQPRNQWSPPLQRLGEPVVLHVQRIHHLVERSIDLIEVRAADVDGIFHTPSGAASAGLPPRGAKPKTTGGAKGRVVLEAMRSLWPNGIPAGLAAKERNARVKDWAREQGLSIPSDRTIERGLRQRIG